LTFARATPLDFGSVPKVRNSKTNWKCQMEVSPFAGLVRPRENVGIEKDNG